MIPGFQDVMLPFLELLRDGQEIAMRDLTVKIADTFKLSEEERKTPLPSGDQPLFYNRVAWAKTHLKHAGLIENPNRGKVKISPEGMKVVLSKPKLVNVKYLKSYHSYQKFLGLDEESHSNVSISDNLPIGDTAVTPQELIESSYLSIRSSTVNELVERLKKCSPAFFEHVVVRVLQSLGYGATGESLVTGKSGDGGIDGVIKEDKLGLDIVCVQAKRWEGTIGRPVVQAFVGSMDYAKSKKGVIISTSSYSKDAVQFLDKIVDKRVILIDGIRLANYMIDYGVGVNVTKRYDIKEVSNDFFEEDQFE